MPHNLGYPKEVEVTQEGIRELIATWGPDTAGPTAKARPAFLDEFVALTGYHHNSAIRALTRRPKPSARHGRPRTYTNQVKAALIELWELSGKLCSKRLAPFLPVLMGCWTEKGS